MNSKITSRFARLPAVLALTLASGLAVLSTGCAVVRDQQSIGSYVDDAGITTAVKARFAEDRAVSALAISVETFKGVVQLSGVAKSATERQQAEALARQVKGVSGVRNDIVVRP